jgi:3-deoxy-D-manno-octulosonic-acid transferase
MRDKLAHSGSVLAPYRLLATVAHRLPFPSAALRASLAGRRAAAGRWCDWARSARPPGPLVWAHGASVGEHQVLEPVLERLARARPDLRIVLSHTSPSVCPTATPADACRRDYLPWDRRPDLDGVLGAVRPALALFARSDLWPEFVIALADRGVPIAVAGARVRAGSLRLGAIGRGVLRPVSRRVTWLGAASPEDADRWERLGVPPERVEVTGDPRHDRILERVADPQPAAAVRAWAGAAPVWILGSLEPSDDPVIAPTLARLRTDIPELRAVLVPHDPTPERLDGLARSLAAHGLRVARWAAAAAHPPEPGSPALLVAARGSLADLYLGADLAYVGGGFRSGRLHAVAEPAAVGLPVVMGPRWRGAADAERMVTAGGAIPVAGADPLADAVRRLVASPAARTGAGLLARGVLVDGAARATAVAALRLLHAGADATTEGDGGATRSVALPSPSAPGLRARGP